MVAKAKQPKLLRGSKRTPMQRLEGLQKRVGGVASGQEPGSAAPRTLPRTAQSGPSVKPKGPTTGKDGRSRVNPNVFQTANAKRLP